MGINRKRKDCSASKEYIEHYEGMKWDRLDHCQKQEEKKSEAANRKAP